MEVQLDPEQMATMGITEDISINLPDGWAGYTPSQRKAWAREQIEAVAMGMLQDLAAAHGIEPTAGQRAAYLAGIQPGIDAALAGGSR